MIEKLGTKGVNTRTIKEKRPNSRGSGPTEFPKRGKKDERPTMNPWGELFKKTRRLLTKRGTSNPARQRTLEEERGPSAQREKRKAEKDKRPVRVTKRSSKIDPGPRVNRPCEPAGRNRIPLLGW